METTKELKCPVCKKYHPIYEFVDCSECGRHICLGCSCDNLKYTNMNVDICLICNRKIFGH